VTADIIASVVAGLLLAVGVIGIIIPVLPGSFLVIVGLLVWAIVIGGPVGWVVFCIGAALCVAGMTATYVLTGRTMRRERIPNRSVVLGIVCGVVGMFVLPALGLPVGFAAGLFGSEYARVRDAREALRTSVEALKATGLGILVEFGCASAAVITWIVGMFVRFV